MARYPQTLDTKELNDREKTLEDKDRKRKADELLCLKEKRQQLMCENKRATDEIDTQIKLLL
jgi:hypothetical protein